MHFKRRYRNRRRSPVIGGHWRLRQLRQFDFGFQYEEGNQLRVVIPLPGINRDTLAVKAKENMVSISASVAEQFKEYATRPDDNWDIALDYDVIPEFAKAKYVDGLLTVDLELKHPASEIGKIEYEE